MAGDSKRAGRLAAGHVANCGLAVLLVTALVFAIFALPLWLIPSNRAWTWALLPVALLTPTHWALLHESIHGLFHPRTGVNRTAGRMLAVFGASSYRVLRFGHLIHHRFNRYRMDRPDCFDPAEISPLRARVRYFVELLGGFYLIEVVIPLLFLLPETLCRRILDKIYAHPDPTVQQVRAVALQTFIGPRQLRELRQDAVMVLALLAAATIVWGKDWPLLLAFLFGRGLIVSFVDNVYHYRTSLTEVDFAYNLRLPRLFRWLILNMNLHRVHHREPHLPWWRLPGRFREIGEGYDQSYGRAAIAQLRGPVPVAALTQPNMPASVALRAA